MHMMGQTIEILARENGKGVGSGMTEKKTSSVGVLVYLENTVWK